MASANARTILKRDFITSFKDVTVLERIKECYCRGYNSAQICKSINDEFGDIIHKPLDADDIKGLLNEKKEEFESARMEYSSIVQERHKQKFGSLYLQVLDEEAKQVEVFKGKMAEALDELGGLSLAEKDEDDNYKNTGRIFMLIELTTKLQSAVSKIIGSDALRELEILKLREQIKTAPPETLLPRVTKGSEVGTTFM